MNIEPNLRRASWLLAAALVASGAARASSEPPEPLWQRGPDFTLGKSAMSDDEVRALNSLSPEEKRRRLDAVLAAHPDDLTARFLRTQVEMKLADSPAVVADSALVLADPALTRKPRLWILQWRAEALIQVRRPDEAIVVANEALTLDASNAEALFARGWARFNVDREHTDGALEDLDRALQLEPQEGIGYYRRATVLQQQGKVDRAAQDFEHALQLVPDDAPTHLQYGILLFQARDFERALAQFDASLRLQPREPNAWRWRAHTDVALDRLQDATADAGRAIEAGTAADEQADAYAIRAFVLERQQDFVGAQHEYERSLALDADDVQVAASLARLQWYNGQFAQAIDALRAQVGKPDASSYTPVWLYIVRVHANPAEDAAAKAELARLALPHQPHAWVDTIVDLALGKTTLDVALVEAATASTDRQRAGQACEANFYAAEPRLAHGEGQAASRLFEAALATCPSTYIEAEAIIAEKRLLAAKATSH